MDRVFGWLRERRLLRGTDIPTFAADGAHFLAELNAIHPFRDGNGRTQLAFIGVLAKQAGLTADTARLTPNPFLTAMIASFQGDEEPLQKQIARLIGG